MRTFGFPESRMGARSRDDLRARPLDPSDPRYFQSQGSMGTVRPGISPRRGLVAIKEVQITDRMAKAAFLTEVEISIIAANARVGPRVYEWQLCRDAGIIVMELLQPVELHKSEIGLVLDLVRRCWAAGIYHNDAYLRNLMRARDGRIVLIDYGYSVYFPDKPPLPMLYVDMIGMAYGHRYSATDLELRAGVAETDPANKAALTAVAAETAQIILQKMRVWDPKCWEWAFNVRVQRSDASLPALTALYDYVVAAIDREWRPPKGRLLKSAREVFCDASRRAPWFGFMVVHNESHKPPEERALPPPTPFR